MRVGVFYHPDFAERGYITLLHRVKPAYDALCQQQMQMNFSILNLQ